MSEATKAVQADEAAQQGFPVRWSASRRGANVSASDGAETLYGRVSADAAEDDVAEDYLSSYDVSTCGVTEAGWVTVEVWRLDDDGDRMAGTKTTASRWHDHRGVWVTGSERVSAIPGERGVTAEWVDEEQGLVRIEAVIAGQRFGASLVVEQRQTAAGSDGWDRVGDPGQELESEYGPHAGTIADNLVASIRRIRAAP